MVGKITAWETAEKFSLSIKFGTILTGTWKTDIKAAIEAAEAVLAQARVLFSWRLTLVILWATQGAWHALGWGRGVWHSGTRPGIGQLMRISFKSTNCNNIMLSSFQKTILIFT